jgi:hypothetical protein
MEKAKTLITPYDECEACAEIKIEIIIERGKAEGLKQEIDDLIERYSI